MRRRARRRLTIVGVGAVALITASQVLTGGARAASEAAPLPKGSLAPSTRIIEVAGANVRLSFLDTGFRHGTGQIVTWVERSIDTVAGYYGRFPTTRLHIRVSLSEGRGVGHGTAFGTTTPLIRLDLGREVTAEELRDDWVLVHELVHLALPDVGRTHAWLSEGLATYVEGVARVQAGHREAERVWSEFVRSMPQGLPRAGDRGLDHTPTWGRTYWGGALFCLLADVEIRTLTKNRYGLQDALRAVSRSSGGLVTEWPIALVLATGDAAVGTTVLRDLYAQMRDAPIAPDLPALWQRLGIERNGASVDLRDDAPLFDVRHAIMQKRRR